MSEQQPQDQEPTACSQPVNPATVNPLDWGIIAAAGVAFIFSMFAYYTVSISVNMPDLPGMGDMDTSGGGSVSGWHGFFSWFAVLCALAGAAAVAVSLFAPQVKLPVPARLAGVGAFAVATLCVLLALFVTPGGTGGSVEAFGLKVDYGRGIGYWVNLLAIGGGLGLSVVRLQQTGGKLPGQK